ncbi:uncharacterized protein LOC142352144 isoform X2 [Convolutriloba macropyga]|uniref:uncharacterized protein LOC142352144 isoform X2 n=1 Tax=Convolutriloba macropyga TaxID=536237 RepID=UPI003F51B860
MARNSRTVIFSNKNTIGVKCDSSVSSGREESAFFLDCLTLSSLFLDTGQQLPQENEDDNQSLSSVSQTKSKSSSNSDSADDLSAQKLKENISRVRTAMIPFALMIANARYVSSWNNPIISLNAMVAYFYLVYNQKLMVASSAVILFMFFLSYLVRVGYRVTSIFDDPERISEPKQVFRDKLKNILNTVIKIQIEGGHFADGLEKTISFYQCEDIEGAQRLMVAFSANIAGLLFLPSGMAQQIGLCFFGYLFFVEQPLFRRFPRLKQRFSFATKLWKRLPNQVEKERRRQLRHAAEKPRIIQADPDNKSELKLPGTAETTPGQFSSVESKPRSRNPSESGDQTSPPAKPEPTSDETLKADSSANLNNSAKESSRAAGTKLSKMNNSLNRLLQMFDIEEEPIVQFAEGLNCYYNPGKNNAFGIPKWVAGKIYVTSRHIAFCGKFLKKESFAIDVGAILHVELKSAKIERVSNFAQTIEIQTSDETFNIIFVMNKDKTRELFIWLQSQIAEFNEDGQRTERSWTENTDHSSISANELTLEPFVFTESCSEDEERE